MKDMPNYIIKIEERYLEWSTISDAPNSWAMPLDLFKRWYAVEHGLEAMPRLEARIKRVNYDGCSAYDYSLEDILRHNRAGPDETHLPAREILRRFASQEAYENYKPPA